MTLFKRMFGAGLRVWVCACVAGVGVGVRAADWYVRPAHDGSVTNGVAWSTAYTNVQTALDLAQDGDTIHVAGGLFALTNHLVWTTPGLTVRGGYEAADDEGLPGPRDLAQWPSVWTPAATTTAHRILYMNGVTNGALDGVTLTGGRAPASPNYEPGGGLLIRSSSNVLITACAVTNNRIDATFSGRGAGIGMVTSWVTVASCLIADNVLVGRRNDISYYGAGVAALEGGLILSDSRLAHNLFWWSGSVPLYGSAVYMQGSSHQIFNCLIFGNGRGFSAPVLGAVTLNNGVLNAGNLSLLSNESDALRRQAGTLSASNTIFWGNVSDLTGPMNLFHCNLQSGISNGVNGNISADPLFERGVYLSAASPCVDAGSGTAAQVGLDGRTTRADGTLDTGSVDLGFHHAAGMDLAVADLYVAEGGDDGNAGTSAGEPLRTVTKALEMARDGTRIHIGAGFYSTASGETFPLRLERFGVQLRGAGPDQTVLSASNANQRVIQAATVLGDGRIEGLTVTGGRAPAAANQHGGGLLMAASMLAISNVWILDNQINHSISGPGYGGGLAALAGGHLVMTDSRIAGNLMKGNRNDNDYRGGGLYADQCDARLTRCVVFSNTLQGAGQRTGEGGGLYLGAGNHELRNVLVASNRVFNLTAALGGGINLAVGRARLMNVTVADNAPQGVRRASGAIEIENSIVWDNGQELVSVAGSNVLYACVKDYADAGLRGCVRDDPLFGDRLHYHLQSVKGRYAGGWFTGGTWATDAADSPLIDAGDPASGYDAEPYPNGARINMGAYGNTAVASKSAGLALQNLAVSELTPTSAVLRAAVASVGGPDVQVWFYFGATDGLSDTQAWSRSVSAGVVSAPGEVAAGVSDLATGQPVYYRAYADNGQETAWAAPSSNFTPQLSAPVVANTGASDAGTAVTLYGEVVSTGGEAPRIYVCWGAADGGADTGAWAVVEDIGVQAGAFSLGVLAVEGSNYWYTTYATNSAGATWAAHALPFGPARTWFVKPGGDPQAGTGRTWGAAFESLQTALDSGQAGKTNIFLLKGGTYLAPIGGFTWTSSHVRVLGGHEGVVENGPGARDLAAWPTVLTRDTNALAQKTRIWNISGVTNGLLEGVTVTGGLADPWTAYAPGAGLWIRNCADLALRECVVTNNLLNGYGDEGVGSSFTGPGAGLAVYDTTLLMEDCVVADNFLWGRRNDMDYTGGGLFLSGGAAMVTRTRFTANRISGAGQRTGRGAGVYAASGTHVFRNVLVDTNRCYNLTTAQGFGMAVASGTLVLDNATVADNYAEGVRRVGGTLNVTNSIVWGHGTDLVSPSVLAFSCVGTGGSPGTNGNIDDDPLFADRVYYHLQSRGSHLEDGYWIGTAWARGAQTSPCVDAGDPGSDYSREPQPNGRRLNMGAYGNTAAASRSLGAGTFILIR